MLVGKTDLGVANSRLIFGNMTINRLAGPALGAVLFAVGMAVPFFVQATVIAFAAVLVARIGDTPPARREPGGRARLEMLAGLRLVWATPPVRVLVLTILAFNVTFGAAWSILVLYSDERLGLGAQGFGVLVSVGAIGGAIGTMVYEPLERVLKASGIMRAGLIVETSTHLVLAVTTVPLVAFGTMFVFGIHEACWGTTATAIRQAIVPNEFQGRVSGVYMVAVFGSLVVGSLLGGVIATLAGITAPFWFGFVGSALILAAMWRSFGHLAGAGRV